MRYQIGSVGFFYRCVAPTGQEFVRGRYFYQPLVPMGQRDDGLASLLIHWSLQDSKFVNRSVGAKGW